MTEVSSYVNRTKVPLMQVCVSWHQLPSGEKDLSALTKNSFSWICPLLTEPKADPWEIQGDLCLALTHTHGGHRVALPGTAPGRNKGEQVLMLLNVSNHNGFLKNYILVG